MHEYQLYNVVCEGNIKVAVDGNNFPDSQIVMNQFDLSLFESMNVHITKKQFKEIFGPQRRPVKKTFYTSVILIECFKLTTLNSLETLTTQLFTIN
jgi:hypothetical protein